MSLPHVINLSTAWEPPDPVAGRDAWVRRFGMPAGLEPGDRIWLVIEATSGCQPTLTGAGLPRVLPGRPWRQDVTRRLGPRNELVLVPVDSGVTAAVRLPAHGRLPLPAAIGSVRLEIESGAVDVTHTSQRA